MMEYTILMSRRNESIAWGFRLQGGSDYCQRLSVQRVYPDSLAATSGLLIGDCIVTVNGVKTDGLTHGQVLKHIQGCCNKLSINIVRYEQSTRVNQQFSRPAVSKSSRQNSVNRYSTDSTQDSLGSHHSPVAQSHYPISNQTASSWQALSKPLATSMSSKSTSFRIPSMEEALSDSLNGSHITVQQGSSFSTGFTPESGSQTLSQSTPQLNSTGANMNGGNYNQGQQIPDQLLNQFGSNKRPEDKPFSYVPSGGIEELQQRSTTSIRQREVAAPPVRAKPRMPSRQTSHAGSESSQTSYDPATLFTPAYKEMVKNQQEMRNQPSESVPVDMVGYGQGKIPQEDVAAYILQPDGTMAALRWNDRPGPELQNSAVMSALMEEQNAQMHGTTSGRIHSTNSGSKQGLSFKVLQWLTGTDSEDGSETASNYSGSLDGQQMSSSMGRKMRHQSFDSNKFPEQIREDDNGNDLCYLYNGSNLPSKSFRRLLRSVSSTPSTDEGNSLPSPSQESPIGTEVKTKRHGIKIVSRGSSQDKTTSQRQPPPLQEEVAYCDF